MEFAAISALIIILFYLLLMLRLYNGWRKLISVAARPTPLTPISIVITFRDEAEKLPALVNSLIPQLNLSAHSEIILVDDHSTDDCIRQLKDLTADQDRIHILQPADLHGKKACQYLGISSAKNNWIVTLDADVSIDQNWLMRLSYHAANSQASVLILPLMISDGKNLFGGLQSLEFFSLIFTTAASASNKNALLCNGAHLAFRKRLYEAFQHSRADEQTSSGDDVFLLDYAKKHERVEWLHDKSILAITSAETSFLSFISQRVRWASKSHKVGDKRLFYTGLTVFLANVSMMISMLILVNESKGNIIPVTAILVKTSIDLVVIYSVARWLCKTRLMRFFPLLVLIYPLYAILIPIIGLFWKPNWKGRRIKV